MRNLPNTMTISDVRKKELIENVKHMLSDVPNVVKGPHSFAQWMVNAISSFSKHETEFKWCVDLLTVMMYNANSQKEVVIMYKGRPLTREDLARDFGVFISAKDTTGKEHGAIASKEMLEILMADKK